MVKWTSTAKNDLKKIYSYIAEDSKYYARRVAQDITVHDCRLTVNSFFNEPCNDCGLLVSP